MLEGNSPNCSRLPHRYAISSPFFAAYFIISSAVLTDLFFDATNFSSHHNNCDTVSRGGEKRGGTNNESRCSWFNQRVHNGPGENPCAGGRRYRGARSGVLRHRRADGLRQDDVAPHYGGPCKNDDGRRGNYTRRKKKKSRYH